MKHMIKSFLQKLFGWNAQPGLANANAAIAGSGKFRPRKVFDESTDLLATAPHLTLSIRPAVGGLVVEAAGQRSDSDYTGSPALYILPEGQVLSIQLAQIITNEMVKRGGK